MKRDGALARFTVIDASRVRAGPTVVRTLADLGARVIELEIPPGVPGGDALRAVNPRLVYASISGFGQDGPAAGWPGFDSIAQGMGVSVTGRPGEGPMRVGIPIAGLCAGHFCAMAIMAAPHRGEQTDAILAELGYAAAGIAALRERHVI
ncbi:MAG: CoA transferase [Lautropia sp.]